MAEVVKMGEKLRKKSKAIQSTKDLSLDDLEKYIIDSDKQYKKIKKGLRKKKEISQLSIDVLRMLLSNSIEVLPKAQAAIKKYGRQENVYASVALGNQIREVMSELRSLSDKSQIPNRILADIIDITLSEILQTAQANNNSILKNVNEVITNSKDKKLIARQLEESYLGLIDLVRTKRKIMTDQLMKIFDS